MTQITADAGMIFADAALMRWAAFEYPEFSEAARQALIATALANDVDPRSYPRQYRLSTSKDENGATREFVHRTTVSLEGEVDTFCRAAGIVWRAGAARFIVADETSRRLVRAPIHLRGATIVVDAELCASVGAGEPGDIVCEAAVEDNETMLAIMRQRDERVSAQITALGGKVSAQQRAKIVKEIEDMLGPVSWTRTAGLAVMLASEAHETNPRRPVTRSERAYIRAYRTALRQRFEAVMIRRDANAYGMTPEPPALDMAAA